MSSTSGRTEIDKLHLVHNSVYSDACFRMEMERIFDKIWNFACHESEIAQPGGFLAKHIALTPVLVTRGEDGAIRAFHNVCRHRGCQVVEDGCGVSSAFQCPYHHWSYGASGELQVVPGEEAYDGSGFRKADFGLLPIRTATLFGLVFVCFDPHTPSLETYLGPELIAALRVPLGFGEYESFYQRQLEVSGNWKLFPENGRDGYHVPFVHPFYRGASPPRAYRLYENGHSLQALGMAKVPHVTDDMWNAYMSHPLANVEPGDGYVVHIWPDLVLHFRSNVVGIDSQTLISWDRTLMEGRVLGLKGDTEDMRAKRRLTWTDWVDDRLAFEDMPVLARQQRGLMSRGAQWSLVARGAEGSSGLRGDDNRLRQFWIPWRSMMKLESNDFRPASEER